MAHIRRATTTSPGGHITEAQPREVLRLTSARARGDGGVGDGHAALHTAAEGAVAHTWPWGVHVEAKGGGGWHKALVVGSVSLC